MMMMMIMMRFIAVPHFFNGKFHLDKCNRWYTFAAS